MRSLHTSHDIRRKAGLQVRMSSQNAQSGDIVSSGNTDLRNIADLGSIRGNDVKDKHSASEAHRALLASRSVDRVWNFALEELGRININFDPAWMSGKNISLPFLELLIEADCLHLRARIQQGLL